MSVLGIIALNLCLDKHHSGCTVDNSISTKVYTRPIRTAMVGVRKYWTKPGCYFRQKNQQDWMANWVVVRMRPSFSARVTGWMWVTVTKNRNDKGSPD